MAIVVDSTYLKGRIEAVESRLVKNLDKDITLAAKRTAFHLMEYSIPVSAKGSPWPVQPLKDRIEADVKKAFPSVGDPGWQSHAFGLIRDNYSEKRAQKFWSNYKNQGRELAEGAVRKTPEEDFANLRRVPRKIDNSAYSALLKSKAIRKNGARQLPRDTRAMAMVNPAAVAKVIRKRQANAGLGKAAWYGAAQSLGGQVNYKSSKFEEGRFVWPTEAGRIYRRFRGSASSTKTVSAKGALVILHNRLNYATESTPSDLKAYAVNRAQRDMRILFEKRAKAASTYQKRNTAAA